MPWTRTDRAVPGGGPRAIERNTHRLTASYRRESSAMNGRSPNQTLTDAPDVQTLVLR